MKALVVTPKDDNEFKFVAGLLKKPGVASSPLTQNELELSGYRTRVGDYRLGFSSKIQQFL